MKLEELRGLAETLKMGMEAGEYGLGTMESLVDAVLDLTDPTPIDAAWLDGRWPSYHAQGGRTCWTISDRFKVMVRCVEGGCVVWVNYCAIGVNATRGNLLGLLRFLGVSVPKPKSGTPQT